MIATAEGYAPWAQERRVGAWACFRLIDPAAAGNATPSSSGAQELSDLSQLTNGKRSIGAKLATLEDGLWRLGSEWKLLPKNFTGQRGYWSTAISGADGVFSAPPSLTFTLSAPASGIGFSLWFDDQAGVWPSSVRVTVSAGDTQLAQQIFAVAAARADLWIAADNYDSVVFEFLETNAPYRFVRVSQILFGIEQTFEPDNIVSMIWRAGASVGCDSIPSRELSLTFDNTDRKYNLRSPNSLYAYLQTGQVIESGITVGEERISMGDHYFRLAEASDSAMTATITANDRVYWLDAQTYDAGASATWTLAAAVADIAPGITANIPTAAAARTVRKCIPVGTSRREALRLVSQAAMCACWINRAGVLTFADLAIGTPVDAIDLDRMESVDNLKIASPVDRIVIKADDCFSEFSEHTNYYGAGAGDNVKNIDNPCVDISIGGDVAAWLLTCQSRREQYEVKNRCNPAVEIGDTISISDAFGAAAPAAVTEYEITYDGGMGAVTKGVGA